MSEYTVGILALEAYFPSTYVDQGELEAANAVSSGKYTIGLGQDAMAFTGDHEDINSICLTAVQSLLEKYSVSPKEVGRLEVGTESLVDKSKSTKTVLMSLFAEAGNTDVEGATVVNACYGGTAALLNALMWCDSTCWDGRYAIVVAGDIAVYADGPARPTGGCGAVAMLVGRNAPIAINLKTRVTHACHVWDFFKPKLDSEYPQVDGALSETCYLRALDDCYMRHLTKQMSVHGRSAAGVGIGATDHFLFHSPYNKLVQKSLARLFYLDVRSDRVVESTATAAATATATTNGAVSKLAKWRDCPLESTYKDKDLETALKDASASVYAEKVAPGCVASKLIGNTYTASVWLNLACLVSTYGTALSGKKVTLFSYGSGALASMLELEPTATPAATSHAAVIATASLTSSPDRNAPTATARPALSSSSASTSSSSSNAGDTHSPSSSHSSARFSLARMQACLNLTSRLESRERLLPANLTHALDARESLAASSVPSRPLYLPESLFPGTYYLSEITAKHERIYKRKGSDAVRVMGGVLARELTGAEAVERCSVSLGGSAGGSSNGSGGYNGKQRGEGGSWGGTSLLVGHNGSGTDTDDLANDLAHQIELGNSMSMGLGDGGEDGGGGGGAFWLDKGVEVTGRLRLGSGDSTSGGEGGAAGGSSLSGTPIRQPTLRSSKTFVWASGRPNVKVVVTGVAAALPGRDSAVFTPGVNNVHRIIRGENCITNIPSHIKDAMLEKNVCLLKKNKGGHHIHVMSCDA